MGIKFTIEDEDGEELELELPSKFEVCGRCEGHGTHLHSDIGSHAYTLEEFHEQHDEEEAAEYFRRGGRYDVTCEKCGGRRVEEVPDRAACEKDPALAELLRQFDELEERRARWDAEDRATYRMECGGY